MSSVSVESLSKQLQALAEQISAQQQVIEQLQQDIQQSTLNNAEVVISDIDRNDAELSLLAQDEATVSSKLTLVIEEDDTEPEAAVNSIVLDEVKLDIENEPFVVEDENLTVEEIAIDDIELSEQVDHAELDDYQAAYYMDREDEPIILWCAESDQQEAEEDAVEDSESQSLLRLGQWLDFYGDHHKRSLRCRVAMVDEQRQLYRFKNSAGVQVAELSFEAFQHEVSQGNVEISMRKTLFQSLLAWVSSRLK